MLFFNSVYIKGSYLPKGSYLLRSRPARATLILNTTIIDIAFSPQMLFSLDFLFFVLFPVFISVQVSY